MSKEHAGKIGSPYWKQIGKPDPNYTGRINNRLGWIVAVYVIGVCGFAILAWSESETIGSLGFADNEQKHGVEPSSRLSLPDIDCKLIPWVEVNAPLANALKLVSGTIGATPDNTTREICVKGLTDWSKVTDTVIVTSRVGQSRHLYPYLEEHKPDCMHIVGGVKTSIIPGGGKVSKQPYDYADAASWRKIADECKYIASVTQTNVVVLENEGALWRFHCGEATIDFDKLYDSLEPLRESGLTVWFYLPDILNDTKNMPNREASTTRLVRTLKRSLPDSYFFAMAVSHRSWRDKPDRRRRLTILKKMAKGDIYPMMYVKTKGFYLTPSGSRKYCYTSRMAIEELGKLDFRAAIIYPGFGEWIPIGQQMAILQPRNVPPPTKTP